MADWYQDAVSQKGIVVSSRIRIARNIKNLPFNLRMTAQMREELKARVKKAIAESDTAFAGELKYIDMADVPENEVNAMVERHIISPEFANRSEGRAIILSADESVSVMIGEEDHIRIQVILAGLQLEKAYSIAEQTEQLLGNALGFAFDSELGYLTECPTNLGTGLRASVMLHLPLCESTGQLSAISETVSKVGFTVRGIYGEGSKSAAALYQISNQITLGLTEKNAIDNLSVITSKLIEKERAAEENVDKLRLEDKVFRALGTLQNSRIMESREMINLLSLIKLGLRMGILKEGYEPIRLLVEGQRWSLMKKYGNLSADERDIKRGEFLREHFNI